MDVGVEAASHAHHTASRCGVGDGDDEHSGALCAEGAQDLFAGGVAVESGLAAGAGLLDGLCVELDDEVRCPDGPNAAARLRPLRPYPATMTWSVSGWSATAIAPGRSPGRRRSSGISRSSPSSRAGPPCSRNGVTSMVSTATARNVW